jgi:ectoine hydroxylase-related dioxygenase (phytanoyl-CoA dioxygenase family)
MSKRAIARRFLRRPTPDRFELRSRALALEAEGRIRDAISLWNELNRIEADPWIEAHLVDLRCDPNNSDADDEVHNPRGKRLEHWPRALSDPFPDVSGRPPEIEAHELSMEVLGGAILHHGSLLVRGLIARERVEELTATIDRAFAGRQQHVEGVPREQTTPWYVPCAPWDAAEPIAADGVRNYNDTCKAVHVADSPRALFQIFEALTATNVIPVINEYLGEHALLSIRKTMLRRVPPDAKASFHQDGTFMGLDTRAVDIWVALTECGDGTNAPGLAVLPKRLHTSACPHAAAPHVPLTPDELDTVTDGTPIVRPHCQPGDALLFDELCLHANGGEQPGLTRHRYALEAWMFARSAKPADYLPILV